MSVTLATAGDDGLSLLTPRGLAAPVHRQERFRVTGRFGDLTAPQLVGILYKLDQGHLDDWADLVEYALASCSTLASLYVTRIDRVTQADWIVKRNAFGNRAQAELAAEFCNTALARIEDWQATIKHLLHAVFVGSAFGELEWERDGARRMNFIRRVHNRHTHRFRYDERWLPRLYDQGVRRSGSNLYGEVLDPRRWLVHTHQEIAGYPNVAGVMRPAIWNWMFSRWVDKFYVRGVEKFGEPFLWAQVAKGTPDHVRLAIKEALENMIADHAAVIEDGGRIVVEQNQLSTSGQSMHSVYLDRYERRQAKLILGASDIVDPGVNGSQGAVTTRGGMTADPRMVADGLSLAGSIQRCAFRWLLTLNAHKFEHGQTPPLPELVAKTASDEVKTDSQDLAAQEGRSVIDVTGVSSAGALGKASGEGGGVVEPQTPQPTDAAAPTAAKAADSALNGAQVSSLLEIIKSVVDGQLPRESAMEIIARAFNMDGAAADALLGRVGKGFVPTAPAGAQPSSATPSALSVTAGHPDPKALSRSAQERQTGAPATTDKTRTSSPRVTTSPTSAASAERLAAVLRGASVDRPR